jgi:TRAP-type mannitol/chloroaromatic compound transport system permease small subunit
LSTQIKKRHITIDAVTVRLTANWQAFVKSIGLGIGVYLFGLLTYLNIPMAIHSFKIGDHTGGMVAVPLYPAKIIIPVATGLVAIQLLIELFRSVRTLLAKQSVNSAPGISDDIK